jgi:hypothetical protein
MQDNKRDYDLIDTWTESYQLNTLKEYYDLDDDLDEETKEDLRAELDEEWGISFFLPEYKDAEELLYDSKIASAQFGSIRPSLIVSMLFRIALYELIPCFLLLNSIDEYYIDAWHLFLIIIIVLVFCLACWLSKKDYISPKSQIQFIKGKKFFGVFGRKPFYKGGTRILGRSSIAYLCNRIDSVQCTKHYVVITGEIEMKEGNECFGIHKPVTVNKIEIPWTFSGVEKIMALAADYNIPHNAAQNIPQVMPPWQPRA